MRFEDTPEMQLSLRMRDACSAVLCEVFGVELQAIERFGTDHPLFILDREHAIDMRIRLRNGSYLLGQEKVLSFKFYKYRTFTIEFWQNRNTKEPGEFFKIASQFYLHGYANSHENGFVEWKILDVLKLIDWLKCCGLDKLDSRTRPSGGSRAAFLPIGYDRIPQAFIHAEWKASS